MNVYIAYIFSPSKVWTDEVVIFMNLTFFHFIALDRYRSIVFDDALVFCGSLQFTALTCSCVISLHYSLYLMKCNSFAHKDP
jgi:hypothetical protein